MNNDGLHIKDKHGGMLEIIFRRLMHPLPAGWAPGIHWAVEAYEFGMEQPPIGFCWVMNVGGKWCKNQHEKPWPPFVEYIRVCHTFERKGVATALLDAARQYWPNLELSPAATPEGEAFLAAYLTRAEHESEEGRAFARRFRAQEAERENSRTTPTSPG